MNRKGRAQGIAPLARSLPHIGGRGQATTEAMFAFLILVPFAMAFAKFFLVMVSVQKMEIASYYAARRWYLESHRSPNYQANDGAGACANPNACGPGQGGNLCSNILGCVGEYMLCGRGWVTSCKMSVQSMPTMSVVRLEADIRILDANFFLPEGLGKTVVSVKNVPFRDRPISYVLPGLQ